MIEVDRERFAKALYGTFEVYSKECSEMLINIWWAALKPYSIDDVCKGLTRHITDTERGQFPPKPADIVRFFEVSEKQELENIRGQAEMQWLAVMKAISDCGKYRTPKFKDPLTAACVSSLGGWTYFCDLSMKELEFMQKRFVTTYTDFERKPLDQLPCHIAGLEDIQKHKAEQGEALGKIEQGVKEFQKSNGLEDKSERKTA